MRTALITGSNRGLGFLLAQQLLKENYKVIMTGRDINKLKEAHSILKCPYPYYQLNVTNPRSVSELYEQLKETKINIDILVNNAAILETQLLNKEKVAKQIMDVNYYGVIRITDTLLPQLTSDAKILVISSNLGKLSLQNQYIQKMLNSQLNDVYLDKVVQQFIQDYDEHNTFGQWNSQFKPIYSASKALLNAYVRHVLAKQVSDNQSVYCIHPGWLKTDMGGKQAPQEPEEGILTTMELIRKPFGRDPQLHGHYFNENGKIEPY